MRIGIDARMLGVGYGIGRYVEQLVAHISKMQTAHDYVLFVRRDDVNIPPGFKKVVAGIPWYSLQEQTRFPAIIKQQKLDLMHFPHWNVPVRYRDPFIVTIHDLTMYHFPRPEASTLGPIKFYVKDLAHRIAVKHAVKKSVHIITTSEFTKDDIKKTLHCATEKMTTIYQAPYTIKNTTNQDELLKKYAVAEPYVLYVGAAYPHKNLEGLLAAWDVFKKTHDQHNRYTLVLAGKENYFYKKLQEKIHDPSISYIGFVPDDDLDVIYQKADLFVFPSLYEGFGLPPLEAMLRGTPVVSSSASCMPEVLRGDALFFDPDDPLFIAQTMHQGLTDDDLRSELKTRGKAVASTYSWEKLAGETVGVYERAMK